ncbi:MAG TPA: hypothetical protein VM581_00050 [Magnetospirillaceae bacterium]|nr:hypothetical protein [Magnetospirillaceae bacterium]
MSPKQQRFLIICATVLFGLMVIVAIFFAYQQSQMGRVVITSTPTDLTLTLDGKPIAPTGQVFVSPGKHELVASRSAFTAKTIEFDIAKGEKKEIPVFLLPEGAAGLEWVKQNPDQASALDGLISNEYEEKTQKVFADNKILQKLPIVDRTFRIDHGISKTGKQFALYIQATDQAGRDDALATLRFYGYDPAAYEIIYTNPNQ